MQAQVSSALPRFLENNNNKQKHWSKIFSKSLLNGILLGLVISVLSLLSFSNSSITTFQNIYKAIVIQEIEQQHQPEQKRLLDEGSNNNNSKNSIETQHAIDEDEEDSLSHNRDSKQQKETVNVLYGLSGNLTGFIDEFEVSLKSVLINSPLDHDLNIHIIVDESAHKAASQRVLGEPAQLQGSLWRNQISIRFYLVKPMRAKMWMGYLNRMVKASPTRQINLRGGIGNYFRMFANRIIPPGTGKVLYMDTDVVVIANLQDVWRKVTVDYFNTRAAGVGAAGSGIEQATTERQNNNNNSRSNNTDINTSSQADRTVKRYDAKQQSQPEQHPVFIVTAQGCAGFMVLDLDRFDEFWVYLSRIPPKQIEQFHDQYLFNMILKRFPGVGGYLPADWSVDLATMNTIPHTLLESRPAGFGYLHFNSVRPNNVSFWNTRYGLMYYCAKAKLCMGTEPHRKQFRETWNLAQYYIDQPWTLTKYLGQTMAHAAHGAGGEPLTVRGSYNPELGEE